MSKKPHSHPPGLEEVDYLQDPDAVIEVGEPDPETGLIRWIEVAYGYRNGKEHMDYVPHEDPASLLGDQQEASSSPLQASPSQQRLEPGP